MKLVTPFVGIITIIIAFLYAYNDVYASAHTGTRIMWLFVTINIVMIWLYIGFWRDRGQS